jgi:hypothetical protein
MLQLPGAQLGVDRHRRHPRGQRRHNRHAGLQLRRGPDRNAPGTGERGLQSRGHHTQFPMCHRMLAESQCLSVSGLMQCRQ